MAHDREKAFRDFRRMMKAIAALGVALAVLALWCLSLFAPLRLPTVIATVAGVFFSMLLGCGLFAAAFFSSKSGHDSDVADSTRGRDRGE